MTQVSVLAFSMAERQDAPTSPSRPSLQIGIASMLVLVVIAALISAGLVYAARIPEIQEEWSVLFGTEVSADHSRRGPQIVFILFTITSPLLIAITLSLVTSVWSNISKRGTR